MENKELEKIKEILKDMSLEDLIELKENPEYFGLDEIIESLDAGVTTDDLLKKLKPGDCYLCNNIEYFRSNYLNQTTCGLFKVNSVGIPSLDPDLITGEFIVVEDEDPEDITVSRYVTWDISIKNLKKYFKKTTKKAFKRCNQICDNLDNEVIEAHAKSASNIKTILGL